MRTTCACGRARVMCEGLTKEVATKIPTNSRAQDKGQGQEGTREMPSCG